MILSNSGCNPLVPSSRVIRLELSHAKLLLESPCLPFFCSTTTRPLTTWQGEQGSQASALPIHAKFREGDERCCRAKIELEVYVFVAPRFEQRHFSCAFRTFGIISLILHWQACVIVHLVENGGKFLFITANKYETQHFNSLKISLWKII